MSRTHAHQFDAEALQRASNPTSDTNKQIVLQAALMRGIEGAEPGKNVLTFAAWRALGRSVMKGEKALCSLMTWFPKQIRDPSNGETRTIKLGRSAAVFHISQTVKIED